MTKYTIAFIIFFYLLNDVCSQIPKQGDRDSVRIVTIIDLIETGENIPSFNKPLMLYKHELDEYGNRRIKNDPNLPVERDFITTSFKNYLRDVLNIGTVTDTTCVGGLLTDTLSRRDSAKIREVCERCGFTKFILVDVQWKFLDERHHYYLQIEGRNNLRNAKAVVPGTWFKIRIRYYDQSIGKLIYSHDFLNFKLPVIVRPNDVPNQHNYIRFFKRVSKHLKKFLQEKGKSDFVRYH